MATGRYRECAAGAGGLTLPIDYGIIGLAGSCVCQGTKLGYIRVGRKAPISSGNAQDDERGGQLVGRLSAERRAERETEFRNGRAWCGKCQQYLPVGQFSVCQKGVFGLASWCKACQGEYDKTREPRTGEKWAAPARRWRRINKERINERRHQHRAALKAKYVEFTGGVCQRCGYGEFSSGMGFHHINPREKDCDPSSVIRAGKLADIKKELDKCILLCRNCHQALHAGDWIPMFVKRDGLGWTIKNEEQSSGM